METDRIWWEVAPCVLAGRGSKRGVFLPTGARRLQPSNLGPMLASLKPSSCRVSFTYKIATQPKSASAPELSTEDSPLRGARH